MLVAEAVIATANNSFRTWLLIDHSLKTHQIYKSIRRSRQVLDIFFVMNEQVYRNVVQDDAN